jgi:hypothetical protein
MSVNILEAKIYAQEIVLHTILVYLQASSVIDATSFQRNIEVQAEEFAAENADQSQGLRELRKAIADELLVFCSGPSDGGSPRFTPRIIEGGKDSS